MHITKNTLKFEIRDELFDKLVEYKTFENLFDITLGKFFREVIGEDYFQYGWELLEKFTIHYFPEFIDSKLFNSIIENLERLDDNKCYGSVMTFSKNSLLAMKAQWDILNEEERIYFLRPAHGLTVGYVLAGAQYFCDLFTDLGSIEDYKDMYPTLFNTSYVAYNWLARNAYSANSLRNGLQYQNIDRYLNEIKIRKNSQIHNL